MAEEFKEPLDPVTGSNKSGLTGVVMLHVNGIEKGTTNWFRFKASDDNYFKVEWPVEQGMYVVLKSEIARTLINRKWARAMTAAEIAECNESLKEDQ